MAMRESIQVERSEETVVRANEDEVRGTVVAARRLRVEHCRREEPEQKERTCVGSRDRRGVRNRPKPSSRIGERRVGDDRHARDERDETDRESKRALDSGIREPRQEPHKASGGDQQPENWLPRCRVEKTIPAATSDQPPARYAIAPEVEVPANESAGSLLATHKPANPSAAARGPSAIHQ